MKAPAWLVGLREAAASLLFSAHCPVCASSVETPGSWCAPCLSRTVRPHRLTLSKEALIRDLKYRGRRAAIPYIRTALSAAELPKTLRCADLAVCVPLHETRRKERGFNQVELIFADWLKAQGIVVQRPLERRRATLPQYGLGEKERRRNMRGAFFLREAGEGGAGELAGKRILLLDDIMTTGETLLSCAAVLRQTGVASVQVLVLASDRS